VGSVRPGDALIRRIGDRRTGRWRRSVGRRRAVLARQGSEAAGLGRGAQEGARLWLYRGGAPHAAWRARQGHRRRPWLQARGAAAFGQDGPLRACGCASAGTGGPERVEPSGSARSRRIGFFEFIFNARNNSR
jgi:hypothetical protein